MDRFAAHFDDVTPEELEAEITEAIATVPIEERATSGRLTESKICAIIKTRKNA